MSNLKSVLHDLLSLNERALGIGHLDQSGGETKAELIEHAFGLRQRIQQLQVAGADPYAGKSPAELLAMARAGDKDALDAYVASLNMPPPDPYEGKTPAELLELARAGDAEALERYAKSTPSQGAQAFQAFGYPAPDSHAL